MKDFTSDPVLAFLGLLEKKGALPEYVKQASIPDQEDLKDIPSFSFADPVGRLFPLHEKAAAFMSALDLYRNGLQDTPMGQKAAAACEDYEITQDVKDAKEHITVVPVAVVKTAQEREFALELEQEDGTTTFHYPIGNDYEVEESAIKLAADIYNETLPRAWFAEAAEKIVKKAAELQLDEIRLPRSVRRLGENRVPDFALLRQQIKDRVKQARLDSAWEAVYKDAVEMVEENLDELNDAIHVWELADRKNKIAYHDSIMDPVHVFKSGELVSVLEKEASNRFLLCDTLVPIPALKVVSDQELAINFKPETARIVYRVKQAANGMEATELCEKLDKHDQRTLARIIIRNSEIP